MLVPLLRRGANNTETQIAVLAVSVVDETEGNLAEFVVAVTAAATAITVAIPAGIPTPLLYISAHVEEAVAVGLFLSYRVCRKSAVVFIPAHFIQIVAS